MKDQIWDSIVLLKHHTTNKFKDHVIKEVLQKLNKEESRHNNKIRKAAEDQLEKQRKAEEEKRKVKAQKIKDIE